jgi:hypothetical protein
VEGPADSNLQVDRRGRAALPNAAVRRQHKGVESTRGPSRQETWEPDLRGTRFYAAKIVHFALPAAPSPLALDEPGTTFELWGGGALRYLGQTYRL